MTMKYWKTTVASDHSLNDELAWQRLEINVWQVLVFVCFIPKSQLYHLSQVVAKKYRNYDIPSDMSGVWRYLKNAYRRDEFTNTCAADTEIETAYQDVAKRLAK